jgi:hypothetical protein
MSKTEEILAELEAERNRLDLAIEILSSKRESRAGRMGRKRRALSAAARRRISLGMRRRWAERKKT